MQGEITRSAALVLFPPTARAYGSITASRRTRTAAPCRTGPALRSVMLLFTKTSPAAHKRVVSLVRTYISYVYIRDCTRTERSCGPQHACISLRDRSQQRWLAFSGYFVARRVCECDSVWGAGAAWRGSFWPTFRAIPPPSVLVPSPLSLIRRPPRPRPGRIHVRAPPPARGAGAQLPALELLYYRVSCGGVCVVQCVG